MSNIFKIVTLAALMTLVACSSEEEAATSSVQSGDTEFVVESTSVEAAPEVQVEAEAATEPTSEVTTEEATTEEETTEEEV
jgi:hypothetical protein